MSSTSKICSDAVGLYVRVSHAVFRPESALPPGAVDMAMMKWVTQETKYCAGQEVSTSATRESRLARVGHEWWYLDVQDTDPVVAARFTPRPDPFTRIGARIKTRRLELGMSLAETAAKLSAHVSRPHTSAPFEAGHVSAHEKGKAWNDRLDLLEAYSGVLDISMWEFEPAIARITGKEIPDVVAEIERLLQVADEIKGLRRLASGPTLSLDDLDAYAKALRKRANALVGPRSSSWPSCHRAGADAAWHFGSG